MFEIGKVEKVLVGRDPASLITTPVRKIEVFVGHGIKGDRHAGPRLMDVRERELRALGLPRGIEIANFRQFSAISVEESQEIAKALDYPEPTLPLGCLGENLLIRGKKLSKAPSGELWMFKKPDGTPRTAVLVVWRRNDPCEAPAEALRGMVPPQHRIPDAPWMQPNVFVEAARMRRGIVGMVYSSGTIHEGDSVFTEVVL